MTEPVSINDLTFGVELEVIMPRNNDSDPGRTALAEALTAAGAQARSESYNHTTRPYWKLTTDGSIGYINSEVVSPILLGEDGFHQLKIAVDAIDTFGCRVNRTTGLHVHVGARERFGQQVGFFKELVRTYAKFESTLDSLVAPSRRATNNTYCGPVRWHERIEAATNINELRRAYGGNRFVKLNLEAFTAHGTVEFRQHQGTTNAQKVENWVKLCLRLVAHAAKNTEMARALSPRHTPVTTPPAQRDLYGANGVAAHSLTRGEISRYARYNYIITHVDAYNPRRAGSRGHENWRHYVIGIGLDDYLRTGGTFDHLRWDVEHGHVTVVDRRTAPVITEPVAAPESTQPTVEPTAPTFERPATDAAPATLDGLLDLVEATEAERGYFIERQMELNG